MLVNERRTIWAMVALLLLAFTVVGSAVSLWNYRPATYRTWNPYGSTAVQSEMPSPQIRYPVTFPAEGAWEIGRDISPGIYQLSVTGSCTWARLANLDPTNGIVIESNKLRKGQRMMAVRILPTDGMFVTHCKGTWERTGE